MTLANDKAKISAIAGLLGAVAAVVYGFVNFVLLAGIGMFLFTMLIQYSSIKIKILVPFAALLTLITSSLFIEGESP